jgi:hypothetical protein
MADVRPGPFRESVGVTIDTNAVGPFLESKTGAIRAALAEKMGLTSRNLAVAVSAKVAGQVLQVHTGRLSGSIRTLPTETSPNEITGGAAAGGAQVVYARPLEYGSRAHIIQAINAKALHFQIGGKEIFAKQVMHPGTRAYAFMRGTLDEQATSIIEGFQETAAEAAAS